MLYIFILCLLSETFSKEIFCGPYKTPCSTNVKQLFDFKSSCSLSIETNPVVKI